MFKAFEDKGFQISFDNGFEVSVMFGKGNYCNNRYTKNGDCENAEIAIFHDSGHTVYADGVGGYLGGWQSPENISSVIAYVSGLSRGASFINSRQVITEILK